jgi:transcriptional regulator with XRE-family HTH domain
MEKEVIKFSQKLRENRLKKKLSQNNIARVLGIQRSYISELERRVRNLSLLTVQKVAKAININVKDLI